LRSSRGLKARGVDPKSLKADHELPAIYISKQTQRISEHVPLATTMALLLTASRAYHFAKKRPARPGGFDLLPAALFHPLSGLLAQVMSLPDHAIEQLLESPWLPVLPEIAGFEVLESSINQGGSVLVHKRVTGHFGEPDLAEITWLAALDATSFQTLREASCVRLLTGLALPEFRPGSSPSRPVPLDCMNWPRSVSWPR
jgi:hypothetical protein